MSSIDTCEKCGEEYNIKTVHQCSGKMSEIPESKKPRVTSGIDNMIDECSKWYHNTQEWYEDSWDSGVSCNEQIRNEMNKVDEAYEQLQKQNQELIKALEFYAEYPEIGQVMQEYKKFKDGLK